MSGEERVQELLGRLRGDTPPLTEDELRSAARSAGRKPRTVARSVNRGGTLGRRAAVVAVAAALLVGSGLGFGLGSSVTPTGSAGTNLIGFGFVPAKGWTVLQTDLASPGVARAIATNVDLHPDDRPGAVPRSTIESLPRHGVVIVAKFTPRGDPERDFRLPARDLPLDVSSAQRVAGHDALVPGLVQYRLEAAVGAYNLRADIYLGDTQLLASAQGQLNRLLVASDRVTIFARPTVVRDFDGTTIYGSVDSRRADEAVTIQARDCGQPSFRVVAGATTEAGGGWSTTYYPRINTIVRAMWKDATSSTIAVRQVASVSLRRHRGGELRASAGGRQSFWRKRVRVERLDRRLGRWRLVRSLQLTESYPSGGGPLTGTSASWAGFKPKLPKGTLLRAVVPLSEARPCYLAGTSRTLRW